MLMTNLVDWSNWNSIRAFPSKNANILAFNILKPYFIYFNLPLYNTSNIKVSIFLAPHLNILYLLFVSLFNLYISLPPCISLFLLWSRATIKHQMVQTCLSLLNPTNPHNHHYHRYIKRKKSATPPKNQTHH